jgi:DNA-binding transcriptional ArsR family regulator
MSITSPVSAHAPGNSDPALLKRITVQRHKLLEMVVRRLTTSMTTGDKHHLLLIGPDGSGKTHLVSLAVWALRQNSLLSDTMRIAWLGEDDVFSGLVHLAFAIANTLSVEYPDEFPADFKSGFRGLPRDDAALAVLNTVLSQLGNRHLLLVTENLDQTFESLGESGQKKLRAFLQETRRIAILSTSRQLFSAVSSRQEAFFGFFDTHHLQPLSVDDALQLMQNIAVAREDAQFTQFLSTEHARNRVHALHHLIAGNCRLYVLLAGFLTHDALDDLVPALQLLAEEMTQGLQERLHSLPDQQRQLLQCLCDTTGAMTVREIAEATFIAEGSCSSQLGGLRSAGWVRSEKRGKESYYELADPFIRLCLQFKRQHGRPLNRLARFLKAWFSESQGLLQRTATSMEGRSPGKLWPSCTGTDHLPKSFDSIRPPVTHQSSLTDYTCPGQAVAEDQLQPCAGPPAAREFTPERSEGNPTSSTAATIHSHQAQEHLQRGMAYWQAGNWQDSLTEFATAASSEGHDADVRTQALFAVPLAAIALRSGDDLMISLKNAFSLGDRQSDAYGGFSFELLSMLLKRGPSEWAVDVSRIAPLYLQAGVADKLGQSLTRTIRLLDEGDFSASQLELWYRAWLLVATDCEDLQIPLACLKAAVEILKADTPGDRPLFRLPIEVRQLIRPLLQKSLADVRIPGAPANAMADSNV